MRCARARFVFHYQSRLFDNCFPPMAGGGGGGCVVYGLLARDYMSVWSAFISVFRQSTRTSHIFESRKHMRATPRALKPKTYFLSQSEHSRARWHSFAVPSCGRCFFFFLYGVNSFCRSFNGRVALINVCVDNFCFIYGCRENKKCSACICVCGSGKCNRIRFM